MSRSVENNSKILLRHNDLQPKDSTPKGRKLETKEVPSRGSQRVKTAKINHVPINRRNVQIKTGAAPLNITDPLTKAAVRQLEAVADRPMVDQKTTHRLAEKASKGQMLKSTELKKLEGAINKKTRALEGAIKTFKEKIDSTHNATLENHMKQVLKNVQQQHKRELIVWNALEQVADYNENAEKELKHMTDLGNKLQKKGKLSFKEQNEFSQTLWTHKENTPILQNHLSRLRANLNPESSTMKILDATINNLANNHMALANIMSLHSEHLPDRPPFSRAERLNHHLTEAKAARVAVKNLKNNYLATSPQHHAALNKIDKKLAQHEAMLVKLQSKSLPLQASELQPLLDMPVQRKGKIPAKIQEKLGKQMAQSKQLPLAHHNMTQEQMLGIYINHELKNMKLGQNVKLPDISFLQRQGTLELMNTSSWDKINHAIEIEVGGEPRTFNSQIMPAATLSKKLQYPYQGGVSSHDRMQYDHAVNLARTTLVNRKGEELFSAYRSGVFDSYYMTPENLAKLSDKDLEKMMQKLFIDSNLIRDPNSGLDGNIGVARGKGAMTQKSPAQFVAEFRRSPAEAKRLTTIMRTQVSKEMAKDATTTMLVNDPALLARALKGEVVTLPITSISLMTPDYLREAFGMKGSEQAMLRHHIEGFDALRSDAKPTKLYVRDDAGRLRKVDVRVQPRYMSFGVNAHALRALGAVKGNRLPQWQRAMGWELAAEMNNPVLLDMVGQPTETMSPESQVASKIKDLKDYGDLLRKSFRTAPPKERLAMSVTIGNIDYETRKISQLNEQVKQIWGNRSFTSEGNDPYKMPARVALLADALGQKTLFHCKSGKDRTGQLDVEMKYLSAMFDATGRFPYPDEAPNAESRKIRSKIALEGGNHEMQEYNTGVKGFKLVGVPALDAEFEPHLLPNYRGGSKFVSA